MLPSSGLQSQTQLSDCTAVTTYPVLVTLAYVSPSSSFFIPTLFIVYLLNLFILYWGRADQQCGDRFSHAHTPVGV